MWKIRNSRRGTFSYICYFTFYLREGPGASWLPILTQGGFLEGFFSVGILTQEGFFGFFRWEFWPWRNFFGGIFFGGNFVPGWIFRRDLHVFGVKFYALPAFNQVNGQFAGVLLLRDKQTVDLDWGLGFHDRPWKTCPAVFYRKIELLTVSDC